MNDEIAKIFTDEQVDVMMAGLKNLFAQIALGNNLSDLRQRCELMIVSCNILIKSIDNLDNARVFITIKNRLIHFCNLIDIKLKKYLLN